MDPLDFRIQYSEFFVFYMYIKLILLTSSLLNIYFFCSQIIHLQSIFPIVLATFECHPLLFFHC